jgi:aminoglycoside 6'-N-acetyltransferase I
MNDSTVRLIRPEDLAEWLRLRRRLWPRTPEHRQIEEASSILSNAEANAVLVADIGNELAGFVEVSMRDHVEGCETGPVGYIEGWYVEPEYRRRGIGRALMQEAEAWAARHRCREMASDAALSNRSGQRLHAQLGYEETERRIVFRKRLDEQVASLRATS